MPWNAWPARRCSTSRRSSSRTASRSLGSERMEPSSRPPGPPLGSVSAGRPRRCSAVGPCRVSASLPGPISTLATARRVRCVVGSKRRRLSTSSPKRSIRTGVGRLGGQMSTMPPRRREDARLFDDVGGVVARLHPVGGKLLQAQCRPNLDRAQRQAQLACGQRLLHQGPRAGDHEGRRARAALQRGECGEPALPRAAAPGDAFIGKGVGIGEEVHGRAAGVHRWQPGLELVHQLLGHLAAGGHEHERPRPVLLQARHHEGARGRQECLGRQFGGRFCQERQAFDEGWKPVQQGEKSGEVHGIIR